MGPPSHPAHLSLPAAQFASFALLAEDKKYRIGFKIT